MDIAIKMPRLGLTMKQGTIEEWYKSEGEYVEKGEALCVIANEKMTSELESPTEGFLVMRAPLDTLIEINAVIAEIAPVHKEQSDSTEESTSEQEKIEAKDENKIPVSVTQGAVQTTPDFPVTSRTQRANQEDDYDQTIISTKPLINQLSSGEKKEPTEMTSDSSFIKDVSMDQQESVHSTNFAKEEGYSNAVIGDDTTKQEALDTPEKSQVNEYSRDINSSYEDIQATPIARKMAKKYGIDLTTIEGTGGAGRIVKEDVKRARDELKNQMKDANGTTPLEQQYPEEASEINQDVASQDDGEGQSSVDAPAAPDDLPIQPSYEASERLQVSHATSEVEPKVEQYTVTDEQSNELEVVGNEQQETDETPAEIVEEAKAVDEEPVVEPVVEIVEPEAENNALNDLNIEEPSQTNLEGDEQNARNEEHTINDLENPIAEQQHELNESEDGIEEVTNTQQLVDEQLENPADVSANHLESSEELDKFDQKVGMNMQVFNDVQADNTFKGSRVMKKLMKQPMITNHTTIVSSRKDEQVTNIPSAIEEEATNQFVAEGIEETPEKVATQRINPVEEMRESPEEEPRVYAEVEIKDVLMMTKSIRITALEAFQKQLHKQLQFKKKNLDVSVEALITRAIILGIKPYSDANTVLLFDGQQKKHIAIENTNSVVALSENLNSSETAQAGEANIDLFITANYEELVNGLLGANQSPFNFEFAYKLSNDVSGKQILSLLFASNDREISRDTGREILREIVINLENPMLLFL
ncbi:MAG: E3 binding domain-containing protein [Kurthia sp.]|nr:E3 binding domain-containing protein [Candidatus Kurthia equi]